MKKRIVSFMMVCLFVFTITFAAAWGKSSEPAKPRSISIICTTDDQAYFKEAGRVYKEKYGIGLEIIAQNYDNTHNKIAASVLGGAKIDITYVDTVWPAEFAAAKILVPVDKYLPRGFKENFINATIDQMVYNEKTYAIPFSNNGKWLYYNKKMLAEAGYNEPPKSWDELFAISKKLIADKKAKYGMTFAGMQSEGLICDFTTFLYGFGGKYMDKKGKFVYNSPEAVKAVEMIVNSMKDGLIDPASLTYTDRTDLDPFLAGEVPFVMDWSFAWGLVNDSSISKVAGNIGIALIPGDAKAGVRSSSVTGGGGLGILSSSKNPQWAWKFIELISTPEMQKKALEMANLMPTLKVVYYDADVLAKYPVFKDMVPQLQYMHFRPVYPKYGEWSQITQVALNKAYSGKATPKQALDEAVKQANKLK
jgi:multiple sugar transport system substrate-binding protein